MPVSGPSDTELLYAMNVHLARVDERVIALKDQIKESSEDREEQHKALKTEIGKLATTESVAALAGRVDRMEGQWTWLIRTLVGGPTLAAIGFLISLKQGWTGK